MNTDTPRVCAALAKEPQRCGRAEDLFRHCQEAMAEGANNLCSAEERFNIFVLVAMKKEFRAGTLDVAVKGNESHMDFVIAVMNEARGIVRHKNVDRREIFQQAFHITLLEQKVSHGLVFPGAAESSDGHAANLKHRQ